jgi:hypothetical protein
MSRLTGVRRFAIAVGMILSSQAASAFFYSEVKPAVKVGVDCVGKTSLLAPQVTACTTARAKTRIWCPNGQMFEGPTEDRAPAASLARSLCNMAQVPDGN